MAKTSWPTYANVVTYFSDAGINPPASGLVTDLVDETVEQWDQAVGYTFYSDGASGTTYYDAPQFDKLVIPYHSSITQVSVDGTVLTANTDYWVKSNTVIEFNTYISCSPKGIAVTGVKGYSEIPTVVWRTVMDYVAYKVCYLNPQNVYKMLKQEEVELTFGKGRDVEEEFYKLAKRYR